MTTFYEDKRGTRIDEKTGLPLHNHSLTDFDLKPCNCGDSERDMPKVHSIYGEKFLESLFGLDVNRGE